MITVSVLRGGSSLRAEDIVCGDGVREGTESCDDGNLVNGDGCSNSCSREQCGNGATDTDEQCDDSNLQGNDGCNRFCQIEFCGDRKVQEPLGEECDDGNGISLDGCSSLCKNDGVQGTGDATQNSPEDPEAGATVVHSVPVVRSQVPPAVILQANLALDFLSSPLSDDVKKYLTPEELLALQTIVKNVRSARRLTGVDREWALVLHRRLQEINSAERLRYTDLLKQFIATKISDEVLEEKELQKPRLIDVEVPVAINELQSAVLLMKRGELTSEIAKELQMLRRQGLDLRSDIPPDALRYLESKESRPIEVFASLKTLKEAAEPYATRDVPLSLLTIRDHMKRMEEALPVFEREYGLAPEDIRPLLQDIDTLSLQATKQDLDRVVGAVNRLLLILERKGIFSPEQYVLLEDASVHAAAQARGIADTIGETPRDLRAFIEALGAAAPDEYAEAFSRGTVIDQRRTLIQVLEKSERIQSLRSMMLAEGDTVLEVEYRVLKAAIARTGDPDWSLTPIPCDDSVGDALACVQEYLGDLESGARNRNTFTRVVGYFQDLFGIE